MQVVLEGICEFFSYIRKLNLNLSISVEISTLQLIKTLEVFVSRM